MDENEIPEAVFILAETVVDGTAYGFQSVALAETYDANSSFQETLKLVTVRTLEANVPGGTPIEIHVARGPLYCSDSD